MRSILSLFAVATAMVLAGDTLAVTYYVSPTGNDANAGTSTTAPWRTIDRVNQLGAGLNAGDQVLFQRGGVYRGKLTISDSGTPGSPMVVGAYGTGADPVITGSVAVTGWTVYSGNIWQATVAQDVKYVYYDGALQTLARYPNTGWLRTDNASSTSTVDAALTQGSGYFTGATLVLRTTNWSYDTARVTAHTGTTLTHTSTGNTMGAQQWGYFLRNKLNLLDAAGEWYYDKATDKLYIWCPSNANPNSHLVEAAVLDNGIYMGWQRHDWRIQNLQFRHQTDASLRMSGTYNVEVSNCSFTDTYQTIRSTGSEQNFHHLTISDTYGTAVMLLDNNSTFAHCTLTDIALHPGLGESNWGYFGIRSTGSGMTFTDNEVTGTGYIGMVIEQDALIERNVVKQALAILNDGGGIAIDNADGLVMRNNLVMDMVGNTESVAPEHTSFFPICHGIYFGNISIKNTLVQHNTVANCLGSGIHVDHTMVSTGNQIKDNVLFNNTVQLSISDFSNCNGPGATAPYHVPAFNDVYTGNVMYALSVDQLCMRQYHVYSANWVDYGTFNNNYYFNPYNDRSILQFNTYAGVMKYFSLERWQAERGEDAGSFRSPKTMSPYEVTDVLSANLVPNGSFAYDVNGWSGWPAQGQITHDYGQLDNGALKVHFTNNNTYNEFTLKHSQTANVQNGQWYRMRFSIQSTMQGEVKAGFKGLTQQTGPQMVASRFIPFSPVRRDVTLFFQSDLTDQGNCTFTNHWTESTYWLDNVELHRVAVVPLDPLDRQQLLVNDQPTAQTFSLDGCWSDVQGDLHSGSITVPPYRSVVLVREEDVLCGLSTGVTAPVASGTDAPPAHPNPVEAGGTLQLHSTGAADLRLTDLSGRVVWTTRLNAPTLLTLPGEVRPGTYMLTVDDGTTVRGQKLMVR